MSNERNQRNTDYWAGVTEHRTSLKRFAPLPPELPPRIPQPAAFAKLTAFEDFLEMWEAEDRKRREQEEAELKDFNQRHGYAQ